MVHYESKTGIIGRSPADGALGNDVRNELILAPRDFVAQSQLALLQPRKLQLIGHRGDAECNDRGIEIAVLDAKQFQALGNFLGAHPASLPRSPLVRNGHRLAESSRHWIDFVI